MQKEINDEACYSNEFIRYSNAFKPLNEFEVDLFLFICSKAKEHYSNKDKHDWKEEFIIDMGEFLNKSNRKKRWSKYTKEEKEEIITKIEGLQNKSFKIFRDKYKIVDNYKKSDWVEYQSFSYVSYIYYSRLAKELKLIVPNKTIEFLCNNKINFTPLKLKYMYKLKAKHTKILYMYFRSCIENEESTMQGSSLTISRLKDLVELSEKYSEWYNFKRYVLKPAIREINKNTDIFIIGHKDKMEELLDGRNFKDLSEELQLDIIVDSLCHKGSSGKAIKKIAFHVLDKNYYVYKNYYAPDEADQQAS